MGNFKVRYTFWYFLALLFVFFVSVTVTGLYPVAVVEGSPIFYRTWQEAEEGVRFFLYNQAQLHDDKPINFSDPENHGLLLDIKRNTLNFLIEDVILHQEGVAKVLDFEKLSQERVEKALRGTQDFQKVSQSIYGLDSEDVKELVLLPQARRDVWEDILKQKEQDFDDWFLQTKKTKKVRLLFVPFYWNGGVE